MRLGLTRWGNSGTGSSVHAQTTLGTLKPVPELQAPRGMGFCNVGLVGRKTGHRQDC